MRRRLLPLALSHYLAAQWRWRTLRGAQLAAFQDRRAQQIICGVQKESPFYRVHWAGADITDWRTLPTVDKGLMMANFSGFNTVGITHTVALYAAQQAELAANLESPLGDHAGRPLTAGLSSGTSGERGLFLITEQEIAMWAGVILARALHGLPQRQQRVAFFLRAFSQLYSGVNSPFLQLRYFALTQSTNEVVAILNRDQPQIIVGPGSLLAELAAERNRGALTVAPERLIAVAEVLEPHDAAALQATFGVPVHQIYQCTEGLLAISCAQGRLHIQEDLVALQLEPLPTVPGESQRYTPIVTDLWRTTQPIIRYRLGDIVQLDEEPCPCGSAFRVLRRVEGRMADTCYFTTSDQRSLPFYPAQLSQIVRANLPSAIEYQLVQRQDDQLDIYLAPLAVDEFANVALQVETGVTAAITGYGCQPPALQLHCGLPQRPPTSKRRRVQRQVLSR